jgi:glycosyltransferase involved in cell wall biosynthesis
LRIALFGARGIPHTYSGTDHGVRLIYLPSIETKTLSTPTHTLACMCDVLFRNVDVMLVTNVANTLHCLVPRLFAKKVALNVDGVEWKRSKWSAFGRAYFHWNARLAGKICPDGIITDAVAMQRIYLEEFGTRSVCMAYGANIERSVNPEIVRRYNLEPFQYYLIASRLVPENSADLIIKGFEQLGSNKILAIAGDANYRSSFVDSLKQTRDSRVRFLGHVGSSDDVKELHCNCYAYIHGHSVGGTNPALLKALGYGNCILALDTPFNREVVAEHGVLFENDPADLAAKLRYLEEHPEEVVRYRQRAPQRIFEEYTWDHVTDQYEDYFARLVAGEYPALDCELGMYVPKQKAAATAGVLAGTFEEHLPTR